MLEEGARGLLCEVSRGERLAFASARAMLRLYVVFFQTVFKLESTAHFGLPVSRG